MYKSINENVFDSVLKAAFNEYVCNQLDSEPSKEELEERYPIPKKELRTAKKLARRIKYGKAPALICLKRACIIGLVCLCIFYTVTITEANDISFWEMSAEAFRALPEKIEVFFGQSSVIYTTDFRKYDSLDDLKANEEVDGVLLPSKADGKYTFYHISFDEWGEYSSIMFKIKFEDKYIGDIHIKTPYSGNFKKDKLVNIGRFNAIVSQYDGYYQYEFNYGENMYRIRAKDYDILVDITESLK